jgi:lysozyme
LKYSQSARHITESFEGVKLVAYQDSRGVWTIGYGHTAGVYEGMTCTQEQADIWLAQDIAWAESVVNRDVHVALTQNEFDALVDFVFNCGSGNFEHSTLLKDVDRFLSDGVLDAQEQAKILADFEMWDKSGGKELAGLLRRRRAEGNLFVTPDQT